VIKSVGSSHHRRTQYCFHTIALQTITMPPCAACDTTTSTLSYKPALRRCRGVRPRSTEGIQPNLAIVVITTIISIRPSMLLTLY
jgi:hypothetical protein